MTAPLELGKSAWCSNNAILTSIHPCCHPPVLLRENVDTLSCRFPLPGLIVTLTNAVVTCMWHYTVVTYHSMCYSGKWHEQDHSTTLEHRVMLNLSLTAHCSKSLVEKLTNSYHYMGTWPGQGYDSNRLHWTIFLYTTYSFLYVYRSTTEPWHVSVPSTEHTRAQIM